MSNTDTSASSSEDTFETSVLATLCGQMMKGAKEFGARMVMFAAFALIQGFRYGFRTSDYLFLLCGSILSFCGILGMLRGSNQMATGKPIHPVNGLFVSVLVGQTVPYLFVMYTLCYRGLYVAYLLFHSFHWTRLLSCIFFTLCSWTALNGIMKIQEANKVLQRRVGPSSWTP